MLEKDLMFQSAEEHIAMMETAISTKNKNKKDSLNKLGFNLYGLCITMAVIFIIILIITLLHNG